MKKSFSLIILAAILMASCAESNDNGTGGSPVGQAGSLARFTIANDHLFAVDNSSLNVFNIADPSNAIFISKHELFTTAETIFARDSNTVFIGSTTGMFIYDVSDAPNVERLSTYQHIVACDPVVANEEYAFVTLRSEEDNNFCWRSVNQLDIIDIRNLRQPFLVNSFPLVNPRGLGLYGDTLLICDRGLKVFDVSDPLSLKLLDVDEDFDAFDLIPYDDLIIAVAEDGLSQYRFRNGKLNLLSEL